MKVKSKRRYFRLIIITFITAFLVLFSACDCNFLTNNAEIEPPVAEQEEPTEPVEPTEPEEPTEPTEPEEPTEPTESGVYRIRLILTCKVKGDNGQDKEIACSYQGKTQAEIDGEEIELECGRRFEGLKNATPPQGHTVGADEYRFVGWYYEKENGETVKVDENTVFTGEIFGACGEIALVVKCERVFSPMMPL